jgi:hypothetical protein
MTFNVTPDGGGSAIMASVDDSEFVIADVSRDGAWVSIGLDDASGLDAWR